jgi:hypothetical protein
MSSVPSWGLAVSRFKRWRDGVKLVGDRLDFAFAEVPRQLLVVG